MEEISMISKVKVHITVFDKDVHFLCEISNNSSCITGLVSSNISIYVTLDENEGNCQYRFVVSLHFNRNLVHVTHLYLTWNNI